MKNTDLISPGILLVFVIIWASFLILFLNNDKLRLFMRRLFVLETTTIEGVITRFYKKLKRYAFDAGDFSFLSEPIPLFDNYVTIKKSNGKRHFLKITPQTLRKLKSKRIIKKKKVIFYFKRHFFLGDFFDHFEVVESAL